MPLNIRWHQTRMMPDPHDAGSNLCRAKIIKGQGSVNLTRRPATYLVVSIYRQPQLAYNFRHVWPAHFAP